MKKYISIVLLFCISNIIAQTTSGEYTIKNINVNTKNADFGTAYFGNDHIVFATPREKTIIKNIWKPNEQPYLDLYIGTIGEEGDIRDKYKIKGAVNTKFHEAIVVFTKDLKTVYFTGNNILNKVVQNDAKGILKLQLFKAVINEKGEWIDIEKLPFNSSEYSTGHPALSLDGKKLYFVSDRPSSIGQTDIYVVDILSGGGYSEPRNLGPKINTSEKEMFPFISDDNILYFSSSGHQGQGGLDVFASKILNGSVSKSLNLGGPINSEQDDFAFITKDDKGYFSSNREGGIGDDDIYNINIGVPIKIECNQQVVGVIRNKDTQELILGAIVKLLDANGNEIDQKSVDATGSYSFTLPCETSYDLIVKVPGFLEEKITGTTANVFDANQIKTDINITPEIKRIGDKEIANINIIYFDLDKFNIRKDAEKELDKIIGLMKKYPSMVIEAISHTDSRANDSYNMLLSEKRAKATVDYIVSKGISSDRLKMKGLGETQLVNKCVNNVKCSREEHEKNRRTEFVIINR